MYRGRLVSVTVCVVVAAVGMASAEGPDSLWHRTYGGVEPDYGYSVDVTDDGGYIIAGNTRSYGAGSSDFYLVRTDADGDTLWHRTYGSVGTDYARAARQTPDGGFIVVGSSDSSGAGDYDIYVVKTDADGDTMWTERYGTPTGSDRGSDICRTLDGGYFIAGYTNSFGYGGNDGWLIKIDATGSMLWDYTYGWSGNEYFERIGPSSDGGCILVGGTTSSTPPGWDVYVVKTKAAGDTLWVKTFGGTGQDYGNCGIQTFEGGFMVVGSLETASMSDEVCLIKLRSDGSDDWRRYHGGTQSDMGYCVRQVEGNDGYVIVGWTESFGAGDWDVYLLRTDAAGDTIWTVTYGDSLRDWGWEIEILHHDEYIISGATGSYGAGSDDVYLLRTETDPAGIRTRRSSGDVSLCLRTWPNPSSSEVTLEYALPADSDVSIAIPDCQGRLVRYLDRTAQTCGPQSGSRHLFLYGDGGIGLGDGQVCLLAVALRGQISQIAQRNL